jgi:tetratricopeptide (TPR) repeat protein
VERPNDGKVADNGTFILNDWEFSSELCGVFRAFRANGKEIVSRRFKANLFNNGLSADGCFAVCQTCNSPDPADSSILAVFDLMAGTELASWHAESGWATFYDFPADHRTIRLGYSDGSRFSYTIDGEFLDRVQWAEAELNKGNLLVVERFVKAADGNASPELARRLIGSIDVALRNARTDESRTRAWAYKLRGLCLEKQNELAEALRCYEKALALDPKIGVKRRAEQLRKLLAQ